jgi:hypothetical protein
MSGLHVYGNDYEWIIATSVQDAVDIWCEQTGVAPSQQIEEELDFESFDDARTLKIWCDRATGKPDEIDGDNCELITKTCGEWTQLGRGYLGTTEQ